MQNNERRRRSALYVPAINARAVEKARTVPCDVVIFDLEDAVAPDMKVEARKQAVAEINRGGFADCELVLRTNPLESEWGEADLMAALSVKISAVLLPKVRSPAEIRECEGKIHASSPIAIWAMIETARSVFNLDAISAASNDGRLSCLVMGTNDLAVEMGSHLKVERAPLLGTLGLAVMAAHAHGLQIIDGVYNNLNDHEGFRTQCKQGLEFGFDGKSLIHPNQIEVCNEVFTPDSEAVEFAQRVVAAFDSPENAKNGVIRLDGRMIERLHLVQARRVLAASTVASQDLT